MIYQKSMEKFFITVLLCGISLALFQCKQSTDSVPPALALSGITETGPQSPMDFIGTLDMNDWDPASYSQLTVRQNYWVDKAVTDTILVMSGTGTTIKVHNLSPGVLQGVVTVPAPFSCSNSNVTIQSGQTTALNLTVDTNAVGRDTLIMRTLVLTIANNEQHRYVLLWSKPRHSGGVVVVIASPIDRLLPAYPNPADGYFTVNFSMLRTRYHQTFRFQP